MSILYFIDEHVRQANHLDRIGLLKNKILLSIIIFCGASISVAPQPMITQKMPIEVSQKNTKTSLNRKKLRTILLASVGGALTLATIIGSIMYYRKQKNKNEFKVSIHIQMLKNILLACINLKLFENLYNYILKLNSLQAK
jgi:hypothetical protein